MTKQEQHQDDDGEDNNEVFTMINKIKCDLGSMENEKRGMEIEKKQNHQGKGEKHVGYK